MACPLIGKEWIKDWKERECLVALAPTLFYKGFQISYQYGEFIFNNIPKDWVGYGIIGVDDKISEGNYFLRFTYSIEEIRFFLFNMV